MYSPGRDGCRFSIGTPAFAKGSRKVLDRIWVDQYVSLYVSCNRMHAMEGLENS